MVPGSTAYRDDGRGKGRHRLNSLGVAGLGQKTKKLKGADLHNLQ